MNKFNLLLDKDALALDTYVKLMRATGAVTARMHKHLAASKLTISQFGVLEALFHLGSMMQQELGKKILKTSGNMTMVVDNLEKRGLVSRKPDPEDRRCTCISLTQDGTSLIKKVFPKHADIAKQIFSALDEKECQHLGVLLKKLGKNQQPS